MTDTDLFEQSFNIAWSVLERTGELGEPNDTSQFSIGHDRQHDETRRSAQAAAFKFRNRCVQASSN
jgi:hypothetical protein